jgi:hypothetical protein
VHGCIEIDQQRDRAELTSVDGFSNGAKIR